METKWIYCVCVILGCFHLYSTDQNVLPESPCPSMFQIIHDGIEWYGKARIHNISLGQTTALIIEMFIPTTLPSQYVGALELYGSKKAAVEEIREGQPVTYRVCFPLQSPLPALKQISVNGEEICSRPPITAEYVTVIRLEHTLQTEVLPQYDDKQDTMTTFAPSYSAQSDSEICGKKYQNQSKSHL